MRTQSSRKFITYLSLFDTQQVHIELLFVVELVAKRTDVEVSKILIWVRAVYVSTFLFKNGP